MARPATAGCPYFPLDCNYFDDKAVRLVKAAQGAKAELVLLRLYCIIYSEQGYYAHFDRDDAALLAQSIGTGFSTAYIWEVIQECCTRGLFDKAAFAAFGVLTGEGIQKRYLSIRHTKKEIPVIKEYWVLPNSYFKGENATLLLKLQFFSIIADKTAVLADKTEVVADKTPQSKEKKRKGKKSKTSGTAGADAGADNENDVHNAFIEFGNGALATALFDYADMRKEKKKPLTYLAATRLLSSLERLADEAGVADRVRYMRAVLDQSILQGWSGVFAVSNFIDSTPTHGTPGGADKPVLVGAGDDVFDLL